MKKFIITIDTEGENLWSWHEGTKITTENVLYLQRFQNLCDQYGFKPVWLTDWEMLNDDRFITFVTSNLDNCEVGMHLHAWNNPPYYELPNKQAGGAPYLIEYPDEIIEEKVDRITREFKKKLGFAPLSHRAGRWAMNDKLFTILRENGYRVDCSITPGIDWSSSLGQTKDFYGPDYSKETRKVSVRDGILEVPLTTIESDYYSYSTFRKLNGTQKYKYLGKGLIRKKRVLTLRPDGANYNEMKWLIDRSIESQSDYLMFMLHSSEMMPGGSPTFFNEQLVERLYEDIRRLFAVIAKTYSGCTLSEYYIQHDQLNKGERIEK